MKEKGNARFELMTVGLGGRGIQLLSRLLTEAGMAEYKYVTCLGNYAPVIRGGMSESTIILSNSEISSPIMLRPQAAIVMSPEFLDQFEGRMPKDSTLILDSSVITRKVNRADVKAVYVPATKVASELGSLQVANMVLLGAYLGLTGAVPAESVDQAIDKLLGGRPAEMLALNKKAIREGVKLTAESGG